MSSPRHRWTQRTGTSELCAICGAIRYHERRNGEPASVRWGDAERYMYAEQRDCRYGATEPPCRPQPQATTGGGP